jgi:unsaturated rhamnogalacturonyl hydrolase
MRRVDQVGGVRRIRQICGGAMLGCLVAPTFPTYPTYLAHPTYPTYLTCPTHLAHPTHPTHPTYLTYQAHLAYPAGVLGAQPPAEIDSAIRSVAALPGEPHEIAAAAVRRDDTRVLTIENRSAFDRPAAKRRVVLIGAPNGEPATAVDLVRWFKTRAPRGIRSRWELSALPDAQFDEVDTQSLARWTTFQAPDLIVTIGSVPLQIDAPVESIAVENAATAFEKLLAEPRGVSALHRTIVDRVARAPIAIARLLARRYPGTPGISYIPALSWIGALRVAAIDKDDALRAKVVEQTSPWTSGEKKLFPPAPQASAGQPPRMQLTSVAGTMVFAEMSTSRAVSVSGERAAALFDEGVAAASKEKAPGSPEYGQGWTDDMFMATAVLARSGARAGHEADLDRAARLLIAYAGKLQRPDGVFNHASDGPAAWGRGNGFAAFGLVETLSRLPTTHPLRAQLLDIYRRQMNAVRLQQSPDGSWREVIDEPGAYREETATAMLLSALARGIRSGWLDTSYREAVTRSWRALAAHVAADATVIDVCAGTGAGPTKRYYLDRPAVTGADDRGGAMALTAALDVYDLERR